MLLLHPCTYTRRDIVQLTAKYVAWLYVVLSIPHRSEERRVGKSTTAVSLAAALQLSKKNVLAIDMDGQANLTEALGLSIVEEQTVYGAMCGQYTLPLVKLHNGITVSPSCLDLPAAELELISEPGRELILKGLITKAIAKEHFDYIIIDCPPSLGLSLIHIW